MADEVPTIVLNANQRRHFEVLFARLEDSVTRVERLLAPETGQQETHSIDEQDVADSFRKHAAPVLADLRGRIMRLANALDLRPRRSSRARAIAATLSAEAIRLQDSFSSQLRGYGQVDPSVPLHLDPELMDMARTLSALASELNHHSLRTR